MQAALSPPPPPTPALLLLPRFLLPHSVSCTYEEGRHSSSFSNGERGKLKDTSSPILLLLLHSSPLYFPPPWKGKRRKNLLLQRYSGGVATYGTAATDGRTDGRTDDSGAKARNGVPAPYSFLSLSLCSTAKRSNRLPKHPLLLLLLFFLSPADGCECAVCTQVGRGGGGGGGMTYISISLVRRGGGGAAGAGDGGGDGGLWDGRIHVRTYARGRKKKKTRRKKRRRLFGMEFVLRTDGRTEERGRKEGGRRNRHSIQDVVQKRGKAEEEIFLY